jgi:hypothetical protein
VHRLLDGHPVADPDAHEVARLVVDEAQQPGADRLERVAARGRGDVILELDEELVGLVGAGGSKRSGLSSHQRLRAIGDNKSTLTRGCPSAGVGYVKYN